MEKKIIKLLVDGIAATPRLLGFFVASLFSGQLWVYIYFSYFQKSNRGKDIIMSIYGRVALGASWFLIISIPIYYLEYDNFRISYNNIVPLTEIIIVYGVFIQILIFITIVFLKKVR